MIGRPQSQEGLLCGFSSFSRPELKVIGPEHHPVRCARRLTDLTDAEMAEMTALCRDAVTDSAMQAEESASLAGNRKLALLRLICGEKRREPTTMGKLEVVTETAPATSSSTRGDDVRGSWSTIWLPAGTRFLAGMECAPSSAGHKTATVRTSPGRSDLNASGEVIGTACRPFAPANGSTEARIQHA